jgi:hypothetical protein
MATLTLLPQPRQVLTLDGQFGASIGGVIMLQGVENVALLQSSALRLQEALRTYAGADNWQLATEVSAISATPGPNNIILRVQPRLELVAPTSTKSQAYKLSITPNLIQIEAATPQAIFYAVSTLIQLLQQQAGFLNCVQISDWPDYVVRGVMLDISRDKVPSMATLLNLVDTLASWKINQLQLYTEHTFAYQKHTKVWANASPITGQEILELDAYCKERFIELVPNQNSFGHMHRWLIHQPYAALAEVTDGFTTPWGSYHEGPFSLVPTDPDSLELIRGLYDELLPYFSSTLFNVNCDETFDLGQGHSKELCEREGVGQVYLDFLLKIYAEVKARNHTMLFWGDIINQHPDLISQLPKDAVALEWGYEASHPFERNCARFEAAGLDFYVCPGTSTWCSLGGRTANALGNLENAAAAGLLHGATGYLNTDWGDLGHWQFLPISYLGFAAGAAFSWDLETNRSLDLPAALNLYSFEDKANVMGQVAADLGNIYSLPGLSRSNSSVLFWILKYDLEKMQAELKRRSEIVPPESGVAVASYKASLDPATLQQAYAEIAEIVNRLEKTNLQRLDGELVKAEYKLTARLMQHACRRGSLGLAALEPAEKFQLVQELEADITGIIESFQQLWLARNRPGGLTDSMAGFVKLQQEYAALKEATSSLSV